MTPQQDVVLQITPEFMPDGTDPLPLFADLSRIDGTTSRNLELPLSVSVHVRMLQGGSAIPGEVRVTPNPDLPGLGITSLSIVNSMGVDSALTLPDQTTLMLRAIPDNKDLPPLEREVDVKAGMKVDFKFDADLVTQEYTFEGLPTNVDMQVQAHLAGGGRRVSSIASIVDGNATLVFAPGDYDYQLEITQVVPDRTVTPTCGMPGTLSPSYRVASGSLQVPDSGPIVVAVPHTLPSIDYQGSVQLCADTSMVPRDVSQLTMTLRSTSLLQDSNDASSAAAEAYYQQDVRVEYNSKSDQLEFCAPAIPGDYEVVVNTPPTLGTCVQSQGKVRCGCGIFAEQRLIQAPPNSNTQVGATLALPTLASISGTLSTAAGQPVMGAAIDASALGVAVGIELAADDLGLTQYNRSRQATSDKDGGFRVPLDVGAFDVTIKPAEGSGYAWIISRDVRIANRSEEFVQTFTLDVPVSVTGTLTYKNGKSADNASLAGALIQAYRVVQDADRPDLRRTIALSQTTADEDGNFTLLLPPTIRDGWL